VAGWPLLFRKAHFGGNKKFAGAMVLRASKAVVVCLAEKGGLPAVGGAQIIMDCNQIISDYQGLYYQIIMDCNQIIIRLSWTVIRLSWTVILRL
jgi:hypothetical protein